MRTLTATQQAIVDASSKRVEWLYEVSNQYLNFDDGDGTFVAGQTLTGLTSGATATIDRVVYDTVSSGKLILSNISGTFQDDEEIYQDVYGDECLTDTGFANWTTDDLDDWTESGESGNDPEISEVGTGEGHGGSGTGMCNIYTSDGTLVSIRQTGIKTIDKYYKVETVIDTVVAGGIQYVGFDGIGDIYTTTGTKTYVGKADTTDFSVKRKYAVATDVTLDSVSLKQVLGTALANGTVQGDTYYWTSKTYTDSAVDIFFDLDPLEFDSDALTFGSGQAYEYKIIWDHGITLNSSLSEHGTYAPNTLEFEVDNSDDALTASDFEDATIHLKLVMSALDDTEVILEWKFVVEQANEYYRKIRFVCKDFLAKQ